MPEEVQLVLACSHGGSQGGGAADPVHAADAAGASGLRTRRCVHPCSGVSACHHVCQLRIWLKIICQKRLARCWTVTAAQPLASPSRSVSRSAACTCARSGPFRRAVTASPSSQLRGAGNGLVWSRALLWIYKAGGCHAAAQPLQWPRQLAASRAGSGSELPRVKRLAELQLHTVRSLAAAAMTAAAAAQDSGSYKFSSSPLQYDLHMIRRLLHRQSNAPSSVLWLTPLRYCRNCGVRRRRECLRCMIRLYGSGKRSERVRYVGTVAVERSEKVKANGQVGRSAFQETTHSRSISPCSCHGRTRFPAAKRWRASFAFARDSR